MIILKSGSSQAEQRHRSIFDDGTRLIHDLTITPSDMSLVSAQVKKVIDTNAGELNNDDGCTDIHFADRFKEKVFHIKIYKLTKYMGTLSKNPIFGNDVTCERIFFIEGYVVNTWISN